MRNLIVAVITIAAMTIVGCGDSEDIQYPITPTVTDEFVASAPAVIEPRPYVRVFFVEPAPPHPDSELKLNFRRVPRTDAEISEVKHRIREEMRIVQEFFSSEMERHGYSRKTFNMVTNQWGEIDVVHILLHRSEEDYQVGGHMMVMEDIREWEQARSPLFNETLNVFFVDTPFIGVCARGSEYREKAWMFRCWDWNILAHEMGHAMGLEHDYRSPDYVMGRGCWTQTPKLSEDAADWLHHHRAFNKGRGFPNRPRDELSRVSKVLDVNPFNVEIRLLYSYVDLNHDGPHNVPPRETTLGYDYAVLLDSRTWPYKVISFTDAVTFVGMEKDVMQQDGTRWVDISVYEVDFGDTILPETDYVDMKMIGKSGQQTSLLNVPLP